MFLLEQLKETRKDRNKNMKINSNTYSWSYGKENHVQHNSTSSSSQSSIGNTDEAPLTPGSDLGVEQYSSPRRSPKPELMKRSKSEELGRLDVQYEQEDNNPLYMIISLLFR